jgi:hypothetical protein
MELVRDRDLGSQDSAEISSERETAHLLGSEAMKKRLLDALARNDGLSLNEVIQGLEIEPPYSPVR